MASKKKKPVKKEEKALANPITQDEVKRILKTMPTPISPAKLVKDLTALWNEYELATGAKKKELGDKVNEKASEASAVYTLDNHFLLAATLDKDKYRTLVVEVANQLIAEHDCKTATEKMLAQTAAWAYSRMIEAGDKLGAYNRIDFLSSEKNGWYSMLSKEVDRCTRQYLTTVNALKHYKQPMLNVTFKAGNAFVAQNQQINSKPKDGPEDKNNAGQ